MAQHSIEEVFRAIAPLRVRGIPNSPAISEGISGGNGGLTTSLSQAATEISRLRASYQQQADLITANTQAVQSNTWAKGRGSAAGVAGQVASSVFGGAFGFLSPVISGIAGLFGGGPQVAALPMYVAPAPVDISGIVHAPTTPAARATATATASPAPGNSVQTTYSPQITVHVNAMDSQSFMDRSSDIANAVRAAMLNNHPINGVVADL